MNAFVPFAILKQSLDSKSYKMAPTAMLAGLMLLMGTATAEWNLPAEAYQSGASGEDLMRTINQQIGSSFPEDHGFMNNVACVESNYGTHPNTYREGYNGGVMQVDRIAFEDTLDTASHPGLLSKYETIRRETGIDWSTMQYEDLTKPVNSAIAARLFVSNIPEPIPSNKDEQAQYWKDHYNTAAGAGDIGNFPRKREVNLGSTAKDVNDFLNCPSCGCSKSIAYIFNSMS